MQANEEEEALAGDNKSKDPNPLIDWSIEELNKLDGSQMHHVNAFYTMVKKWYADKQYTSVLMTKIDYDDRVEFFISPKEGGDCRQAFLAGNTNAYKWANKIMYLLLVLKVLF